ncbi:MAG: hypothetical protein LBJ22_00160 [Synergistaceae bacterium]|nr:hypothetical protein [Synergistaceae bacterium]
MNKIYVDIASLVPGAKRLEFGARRIFHRLERQYLSLEAQSMAYCLLNSQSVAMDITENAIQQAVMLGSMSGSAIDVQTFEVLFHAVTLNPSFKIPFSVASFLTSFNSWVC